MNVLLITHAIYTLRAETFAGRNFCEDEKSSRTFFEKITFGNFLFKFLPKLTSRSALTIINLNLSGRVASADLEVQLV